MENQYFYTVIYIIIFTICIQKQLYTLKFSGGELGQHSHNLAQRELVLHEQQLHKLNMAQCEFLLQAELW